VTDEREPAVAVKLTGDEALVLFDLLGRLDVDAETEFIAHEAEAVVLWLIETQLEEVLLAPFTTEYQERLAASRGRVARGDE